MHGRCHPVKGSILGCSHLRGGKKMIGSLKLDPPNPHSEMLSLSLMADSPTQQGTSRELPYLAFPLVLLTANGAELCVQLVMGLGENSRGNLKVAVMTWKGTRDYLSPGKMFLL